MDKRQEILEKYQVFQEYLESIDLDKLKNNFSRQELNEFKSALYDQKLRSLPYEISKMTQKMKEEEYPQLLGIHHFPIINQIDFLTDKQKVDLDEFLVKHRVGNYVSGLWHVTRDEKTRKQLEIWLMEHEVLEEEYATLCPHCHDGWISSSMNKKEKEELDSMLQGYRETNDWELYEKIMERLEYVCMECDSEFEINTDNIDRLKYKTLTKMKAERDKSLDNV